MFQEKFVFAQLVAFLNRSKFNRIVAKYNGDKYVKHLTCWNQFLAMMFGQLSNRESLRDLIVALEAHHSKCYHLGMGRNVSKSSLARANQDRDYRIFEEFAFYLVSEVQKKSFVDIFKLNGNVYAFDSTTIDLCLAVFWWAKFRKKKGGIKVHTLYDVETQIPTFFHITTASTHDSKAMNEIPYETGSYYIFDRAYNKFLSCSAYIRQVHNSLFGQRKTYSTKLSNGNVDCLKMYSRTALSSLRSTRQQKTTQSNCDWYVSLMRNKNENLFFSRIRHTFLSYWSLNSTRTVGK